MRTAIASTPRTPAISSFGDCFDAPDEAERRGGDRPSSFPPALRTVHELVIAGIAIRRLRTKAARAALDRLSRQRERHESALSAEVAHASAS